jgi:wyosine [tRNA(Phe)-imidazoG37] synthetase (radical SAM superfamily)
VIENLTLHRDVFVSAAKLEADLMASDWRSARVVTFSGSGEPTLASNIGEAILMVKRVTSKPVVILTNSTLLNDRAVRSDISEADFLFCKLDAWNNAVMQKIDRPAEGIHLESIVSGITAMKREFRGFLALQTMLLKRMTRPELEQYAKIVSLIGPDEVQLNLPTRPVPDSFSVVNRGNVVAPRENARRLKVIPREDLLEVAEYLRHETGIPVSMR